VGWEPQRPAEPVGWKSPSRRDAEPTLLEAPSSGADPDLMRLLFVPLLTGPLLLAACGSGPELAVPVETMIQFETEWQCDVTRFSFADSQAIDAKEDEIRARFGIEAADQADFTAMLAGDADLREQVAEHIDTRCPAVIEEGVAQ